MNNLNPTLLEIASCFSLEAAPRQATPYGTGHINDTYLIETDSSLKYILQRINGQVFPDPLKIMHNLEMVCKHINNKVKSETELTSSYIPLNLIPTQEGLSYLNQNGSIWRMFSYVPGTCSFDKLDNPSQAFEVGRQLGLFQRLLSDLQPAHLSITLPNFHNTLEILHELQALTRCKNQRLENCGLELQLALTYRNLAHTMHRLIESNTFPVRIAHNDTKVNNILFDAQTSKAVCIVDLDTVMPGPILYDFADLVRSAANTASEDEQDLSKVNIDLKLFKHLTQGYASEAHKFLSPTEIEYLLLAIRVITYELALRFLIDYLKGDTYFKTTRKEQNLDRCRVQFRLLHKINRHRHHMQGIIDEAFAK